MTDDRLPSFPGAEAPARTGSLDLDGLRIAVHEWGDEGDDPLFLVHGGFDFARTYSEFAPRLRSEEHTSELQSH